MNLGIAFALLNGLNIGVMFINIAPVLTDLMGLYGASYTQISVLMSALLWTHGAMQVPSGMIVDRLGIRRTHLLGLVCMGLGNALPALYLNLWWAIGGRLLTGIGTGLAFLTSLKMLALNAPGGRGGAYQAFFGGSFSLGMILGYMLIPSIYPSGWQWVFLAPALACLPLLGLLSMLRLAPHAPMAPSLSFGRILRLGSTWILGAYHGVSYGAVMSIGSWIPALLAEVSRRPAAQLAWGGALLMLVSGLSRISGGFVILRVSPLIVANGSIAMLCMLFAALAAIHTPAVLLTVALIAAWFASINFGALFHLASRSVPEESMGTTLGSVNLIGNCGAILFTLLFGWSKDHLGAFSWGFAPLCALSLCALAFGLQVLGKSRVAAKRGAPSAEAS
jgi:nitrate/nitrite transporter NarK